MFIIMYEYVLGFAQRKDGIVYDLAVKYRVPYHVQNVPNALNFLEKL
jgi:hypothetical protein